MSDYSYDYERDTTYCYPSSNVLKNKLNIRDSAALLEAERNITALRIVIEEQSQDLFRELERENYLQDISEPIYERLAFYLSELNAIHPFREGNGRTQRMFIEILADRVGWEVDFSGVTSDEMIKASYNSFIQNYDDMNKLLQRITSLKT